MVDTNHPLTSYTSSNGPFGPLPLVTGSFGSTVVSDNRLLWASLAEHRLSCVFLTSTGYTPWIDPAPRADPASPTASKSKGKIFGRVWLNTLPENGCKWL
jgi:hypothetical protein